MSIDLYREEWETVITILEGWGVPAKALADEIRSQKDAYRG
jgi:hypothetical protein